jgi:hypothetical protein
MNRKFRSGALAGTGGAVVALTLCVLAFAIYIAPALVDPARAAQAPPTSATLGIGTYDSRAVAIAYARSKKFAQKVGDLERQRLEAQKAGDKKRIAELEAQREAMQVRLHLQGFSTAPIEDVLEKVHEGLADVAKRKNIAAIARAIDYHDASAELVDVTDDLVALFNPDEQTLKTVRDLRKQKAAAIEEVAKMPAKP